MYTEMLTLSSIDTVKKFVSLASQYDFPISLLSDKYKVDAKSIMGIFSLDLSKPVEMQIEKDKDLPVDFLDQLKQFTITKQS
ncbi:MAG: HPr family phosphocarrier protein [Clostridiales bacterium]|jgi:phosphocarrier protein HPr|nr:HPr family phosphocarrier protein [Clostridiales bacterium]